MGQPVTAAIAGVGASRQGKLPGESDLSLATAALLAALDDSGIGKDEIDGLLTMPGTTSPDPAKHYLRLGEHLGINPKIAGSLSMGGATAGALVQQAALAIAAGLADVVACVFGDAARTGGSRFSAASGSAISWGTGGCTATPPTARSACAATWRSTAQRASSSAGSRSPAAGMP